MSARTRIVGAFVRAALWASRFAGPRVASVGPAPAKLRVETDVETALDGPALAAVLRELATGEHVPRAPDLARGLVAAVAALRAAEAQRDALAAAVREERDAADAYDAACAALDSDACAVASVRMDAATTATDALLSGAPADVVRASVVAEYVAAVEAHRLAGAMPSSDHPARARLRDAHRAVVAALAAVKETP